MFARTRSKYFFPACVSGLVIALALGGVYKYPTQKEVEPQARTSLTLTAFCPDPSLTEQEEKEVYSALYEAATAHDVEPELLAAVMVAESGCRLDARSRAGALGLMQLMPSTAKWLGVSNPHSARENVQAAAKYLSLLLDKFNGDIELALAAYNAGPDTVRRHKRIPPYRETRFYVKRVIFYYQALQQATRA